MNFLGANQAAVAMYQLGGILCGNGEKLKMLMCVLAPVRNFFVVRFE